MSVSTWLLQRLALCIAPVIRWLPSIRGAARLRAAVRATFGRAGLVTVYDASGRIRLRCALGSHMGARIFWEGAYAKDARWIIDRLGCLRTVIDIGANQGEVSLYASLHAHRVIAFEPVQSNFTALQENLALNPLCRVVPVRTALSNRLGSAVMAEPQRRPGAEFNEGLASLYAAPGRADVQEVVPLAPLDHFVESMGLHTTDLVKIDVEGAELDVLEGAESLERIARPVWIVEANAAQLEQAGRSVAELVHWFVSRGYVISRLGERGGVLPLAEPYPKFCNVVAVPAENVAAMARLRLSSSCG